MAYMKELSSRRLTYEEAMVLWRKAHTNAKDEYKSRGEELKLAPRDLTQYRNTWVSHRMSTPLTEKDETERELLWRSYVAKRVRAEPETPPTPASPPIKALAIPSDSIPAGPTLEPSIASKLY